MKRTSSILAGVAFLAALGGTGGAQARRIAAACAVSNVMGAGSSCSTTFELPPIDSGHYVSIANTHGDFHPTKLPGEFGTIELKWFDAKGALVVTIDCTSIGVIPDYIRPNLNRVNCAVVGATADHYATGIQTLTVTATDVQNATPGTRAHGQLEISSDTDMI